MAVSFLKYCKALCLYNIIIPNVRSDVKRIAYKNLADILSVQSMNQPSGDPTVYPKTRILESKAHSPPPMRCGSSYGRGTLLNTIEERIKFQMKNIFPTAPLLYTMKIIIQAVITTVNTVLFISIHSIVFFPIAAYFL